MSAVRGGVQTGRRLLRKFEPLPWLLPSLLLIFGVVVYPAVDMLITSFASVDAVGIRHGFIGLGNYVSLFREPAIFLVFRNTVVWTVLVVGGTIVLSLPIAQLLNATFPGRRIARFALIVPWAASILVTTLTWQWMFNLYYGIVNSVLLALHIVSSPIDWLGNPASSDLVMIWIGVFVSIPFTTYVMLAGLQSIPSDLYEASKIDGASSWRTYTGVVLPLLKPSIVVATVMNLIYVFNSFPIIWIVTQGGPGDSTDTVVTFMYKLAFQQQAIGPSAALAVIDFIVILAAVAFYLKSFNWGGVQE